MVSIYIFYNQLNEIYYSTSIKNLSNNDFAFISRNVSNQVMPFLIQLRQFTQIHMTQIYKYTQHIIYSKLICDAEVM